ncbi:hypothetical protein C3L33_09298, partial [Rhododendron williamsianum]
MPMYQPSSRRRDGEWKKEVGGGGQVLDLETAVKDGILGGGGGVVAKGEKLDLKTMVERLDSIEVPSVFICPISLEPMQDPVTLCTGQTYERSNILKWFSLGHLTCPTTMQELWDDSITPNNTLSHLIHSWFSQKYTAMKKKAEDVQGRGLEILEVLKKKVKGQARVQSLKELRQIVNSHDSVKQTVAENGNRDSCEVGFGLESKKNLVEPAKVSLMVDMLNEGSVETKINCAKMIEMLMEGKELESKSFSSLSLLVGLLRLVKDKKHPNGVLAGFRLLKLVSSYEGVRSSIVSIGGVPQIVELLPNLRSECLEFALYVLEALSSLPEGKMSLKDCPNTIPNMVRLLMRVSENCTQLALTILWGVCEISPEECAPIAVDAGLAAKLLLVIQSGCNPVLKQRSAELLKLCSLNYTTTLFISKCKLTRTIQ